jgi:hypothetical protein
MWKILDNIKMDEITEWSKLSTQNLQKSILFVIWYTSILPNKIANLCIKKNHQIKNTSVLELHNIIAPN